MGSVTPTYTDGQATYGLWDGNLVSELDHNNPVAACDVQLSQSVAITFNGTSWQPCTFLTRNLVVATRLPLHQVMFPMAMRSEKRTSKRIKR